MTALIDRVLEGRSFARATRHPSGLSCATRLVPPPKAARGYEDAYALTSDLLVTTKNLAFEHGCEETEPGWGRLVLCVHLHGFRTVDVPQVGRFELKAPAFVAFYQALGVAKRTTWSSGSKEMSVMTGFALEDPPVPNGQARSLVIAIARELSLRSRPFLWLEAPLDAQMEVAARALIAPPVHAALLHPYLSTKAQELIYLGLSKLLPQGASDNANPTGRRRDTRLAQACRMIHEEGGGWKLSAASIAEAVGLPLQELSARCRRAYGVSLLDLIATTRMARARLLLEETEHCLKEIAFRAGYRHVSNFCTAYKRRHGVTPQDARRRARKG
jgi:AraC-like DNA-binding protein